MGKAWAPAVACLFMDVWDQVLVRRLSVKPLFYVRYIDDLLLLFPNQSAANAAVTVMNDMRPNIKVSEFTIWTSVHFLDLQ
jgi:hypothetical protein